MQLSKEKFLKYLPLFIAVDIAIIVLIIYIVSGQGNLNTTTRNLQNNDPKVESVEVRDGQKGEKNASIKCKDGSTYEIYYPPGETNYDAIGASKCPQD